MAYDATVIEVMIASPSDVAGERQIVREVLHDGTRYTPVNEALY